MTVLRPGAVPHDPRCRNKCQSAERAAWESPAVTVQTANGPRPACPCCGYTLTRANIVEAGRPPNLNPELSDATAVRFEDNICQYEVVFLTKIEAR